MPRLRRMLTTLLIIVIALPLVWFAAVWFLQGHVIWPGRHAPRTLAWGPAPDAEILHLDLDDEPGRVEAWFLPGQGVSADRPGPVVVYAHGNGELINLWPSELQPYRDLGVSVFLPEYRGYGRSDGTPSEAAIVRDFQRWMEQLEQRPDVDADRVIYHGRSIGGGLLASLSKTHPPDAFVLQSTFTSLPAVARRFLVPGFLLRDELDVHGTLSGLELPTLILHGREDTIIPSHHAEANHRDISGSVLHIYPDMDHNSIPPEAFWEDVAAFLRSIGFSADEPVQDRRSPPDPQEPG